jgi:hypothetical protein
MKQENNRDEMKKWAISLLKQIRLRDSLAEDPIEYMTAILYKTWLAGKNNGMHEACQMISKSAE